MELKDDQRVREYVDNVASHIKCREMHEEIKTELESHVEGLAEEYSAAGISDNEAIDKAISCMGDSEVVGKRLNKIHKTAPEWSILILMLFFAASGLFAIYFIEAKGVLSYGPSGVFYKSLVFTVLGLVIVTGLYFFDYRKIKPFSKHIYLGTTFILFLIVHTGSFVAGSLQHSFVQASPIILVIALAGILDEWQWGSLKMFWLGLGLLAVPVILMTAYPALHVAVIFVTVAVVLMIVSGLKFKYVLTLAGSGLAIIFLSLISQPYKMSRLTSFINPQNDPLGSGYISIQLHNLLQSAGLLGQGFNFSGMMVPEIHTEFIFGYIVYTFGWLTGVLLIGLIAVFTIRLTSLVKIIKESYGRLLLISFSVILSVQFLWNILMVLGLAPIAGVPLPFISYGNTQFVVNMLMVGLILSIYKRKMYKNEKPLPNPAVL